MIARKYGVFTVCHRPGAALSNSDKMRYLSAHADTVSFSGGLNTASASMIHNG